MHALYIKLDTEEMQMITERLESVVGMKCCQEDLSPPEVMDESQQNTPSVFLGKFLHLVSLMKSLDVLHFFADFAVADIMQSKVGIIQLDLCFNYEMFCNRIHPSFIVMCMVL
jgi:hypothetical protein